MLELAVAGAPGFAVERAELERPGPSYTVDTLRALRDAGARASSSRCSSGPTRRPSSTAWHRAEEMPALATVVVFARPGSPVPVLSADRRVIEVPAIEISATEIRRRVREGRSDPLLGARCRSPST